MKLTHKPSMISMILPILIVSMFLMILACERTIATSSNALRSRALETCQAEISYISDALYSQLTEMQLQNVEILNHETVLALTVRSAILDRYETVTYENSIMKMIRSRLAQQNLAASAQLYIPTIRTLITPQKSSAVTEEEMQTMAELIRAFPDGMYYTDDSLGFWSASPLIRDPASLSGSRLMFTSIRRDALRSMLQKYTAHTGDYQLLLTYDSHVLANSHDILWDESVLADTEEGVKTVSMNGSRYYMIRAEHDSSRLSLVGVLLVDHVMRTLYRHRQMLRILEAVCVLIMLLFTAAFYRVIIRPVRGISGKLREVGKGDFSVRMTPERTRELNDVASTFNTMAEHLQQLIDREYTSRLLAAGAEKKALQYQISPHFLYNTYFQLRNLIVLEENEHAQHLADLMGRYLRYIVHQEGNSATLSDEMEHARNYAEIQSMRFAGRIEVRYDVPDGAWQTLEVPRLLVQPLIENAFLHGLKQREAGGLICLGLRETDGRVMISVEDNGQELTDAGIAELSHTVTQRQTADGDSVALANIHRRLQLHFGPDSGLYFARSDLGGLKVSICISTERSGE